jgi:hypothetical protein
VPPGLCIVERHRGSTQEAIKSPGLPRQDLE